MKKLIKIVIFFFIFIFTIVCYSRYIEPTRLVTKEIALYNDKLPDNYDGLKIIHFSDLHYPRLITTDRMNKLIKEINLINPDIIVFTGDLLDKDYETSEKDIKYLSDILSKMNAKYGKYAVTGNHDYKKDINILNTIYSNSDFKLLDNDYDIIYNNNNDSLFIGGLSTVSYHQEDLEKAMSYFSEEKDIDYKIILVHEPDYADEIIEKYPSVNLILSGHSHNGQVNIPFIKEQFLPAYSRKYFNNHYKIKNTELYVSSGIGVSKVNFRLFNPPSINFYRINKSN